MHERKVLLGLAIAVALAACSDDDPAAPKAEVFSTSMNSSNETGTAFTSPATGTATITVQGNTLNWTVHTSGFAAGTTAPNGATTSLPAHIHRGAAGQAPASNIMVVLGAKINGDTTGSIVVADSVLTHMRAGNAYVNVHTAAHPAGEIRGQLAKTQ
jgi:hypothetical protein